MQYDMDLQWRPGTKHQFDDALSRSHGLDRGATVDDSFAGDNTTKRSYRGPQGPVLDGVHLGQMVIEGINNNNALPLTGLAAVTFAPDLPPINTNTAGHRTRAHSLDSAPMLPKTVVIGCGGGSSIRALHDICEFTDVTDHNWRALESTRANSMATRALSKRTCPGDSEYGSWVKSLKPEIIIGEHIQEGKLVRRRTTRHSRSSYHHCPHLHFLSSPHLLVLETTPYLPKSAIWTTDLSPLLSTTGYCWKAVEISAQQVGVPSTKRKTFVACVRNHSSAKERLTKWKARLTSMRAQPVTLGELIGREGSYFLTLSRKKGEQGIFSSEEPILPLTRNHILGEKPPSNGYLSVRPTRVH